MANFYLNTHPVWVAMAANIITLTLVTLFTGNWRFSIDVGGKKQVGYLGSIIAIFFLVIMV